MVFENTKVGDVQGIMTFTELSEAKIGSNFENDKELEELQKNSGYDDEEIGFKVKGKEGGEEEEDGLPEMDLIRHQSTPVQSKERLY